MVDSRYPELSYASRNVKQNLRLMITGGCGWHRKTRKGGVNSRQEGDKNPEVFGVSIREMKATGQTSVSSLGTSWQSGRAAE